MNTRAAIALMVVAMDPIDVVQQGARLAADRRLFWRAPGLIARRRDLEHTTHDRHRVIGAAIFDEAESVAARVVSFFPTCFGDGRAHYPRRLAWGLA
jgi:hypothetical protein